MKDPEGNWDLRPHSNRLVRVDETTLRIWQELMDEGQSWTDTGMVYTVNQAAARALEKLAKAARIGSLGLSFSPGWHEKNDRTRGYFESEWGQPEDWEDVILQGPQLPRCDAVQQVTQPHHAAQSGLVDS